VTFYLVDSLGNRWVKQDSTPPPSGYPDPVVDLPDGIDYDQNSRGRYGRIWDDMYLYGESRTHDLPSGIQFTNMIQSGLELYYKDGKLRVKGKPTIPVTGSPYWDWMLELMGETVRNRFQVDGYGFMDNGPDKLYCLPCGCQLVHELDTLYQGGLMHSLCEAMDFEEELDTTLTPRTRPDLFFTQVLVSSTASRDYNILCDRGAIGGNGRVQWPNAIYNRVPDYTSIPLFGLERYKIAFFPRPPFQTKIYQVTLVLDGVWREPAPDEGVDVTIDKLRFNGGDVYGLARETGEWYALDIMLVHGTYDLPAYAGDMDDRRVFVSPWNFPPGVPDIGWTYKHYPPDYPWPGLWAPGRDYGLESCDGLVYKKILILYNKV